MKKILTTLLSASLLLSLSACSAEEPTSNTNNSNTTPGTTESTETTNLEELTLVLDWTPNTNHTGFYVAQELGYYEDEGLSLSIVQPPEDGAALLVATGSAQFGVAMQDSMAEAFISDTPLPVTTIATLIQHNTSGLLSLSETGINSPKDLEGKAYATWDIPVEQAMIRAIVAEDGGDFDQIDLIPSTVTDVLTALQTNIDTVWVYYAWDGIAAQVKGLDTNYLDFGQLMPELDFYTPTIIASDSFLAEDPDSAKAFLRATAQGYEYAIENPAEAAEILLSAAPELDEDIVHASQAYLADQYKAEVAQWGYIDQDRWDGFYFWLAEEDLVEGEVTPGLGFTNEYLPD